MKKLLTVVLMIVAIASGVKAAEKKNEARIKFEKTTHDFGNIREDGGPVTYEFTFTNEGKDPLKITSARAECGCTRPEYPKEEIAPGESGVIKVTYNPLGRPGGFTKVVTVRCSGNPGKVTLKIRGSVIPKDSYSAGSVSFDTTVANFGEIPRGVRRKSQIIFYNIGTSNVSPTFSSDSDALTMQVTPQELKPGERGLLTIYLDSSKLTWLGAKHLKISGSWNGRKEVEIDINAVVLPPAHSGESKV